MNQENPNSKSAELAACRKEADLAEHRYHAFLEFLPDPVFVVNLDGTVSYLNPAFAKVFGWTLEELANKHLPFVPKGYREEVRKGLARLAKEKVIHGFETKRLTKDGRMLDIVIDGALFYDENNTPAGQVVTLRDVTDAKRTARSNQALFRIAEAIHHYRGLDGLLAFITKEIQNLLGTDRAHVILADEERQEFFFRAAAFADSKMEAKFREIRFPLTEGITGHVYRSGKPMLSNDYHKNPYAQTFVDQKSGYVTRNLIQVPMGIENRIIGVLSAANKLSGRFEAADIDLLTTVASMVALPIENARINQQLQESYQEVQSLNRAKDNVIHHLSHEIKTPLAVLTATLVILNREYSSSGDEKPGLLLERAQRNLNRLLEMQYEIEDILRHRDYRSYSLLSTLLDVCTDELEILTLEESDRPEIVTRIRGRIEDLFGPRQSVSEEIQLDRFVKEKLAALSPKFAHRTCRIESDLAPTDPIRIPADVLGKIIEGLVRNAVENTPDQGLIIVSVRRGERGPEFEVHDFGIGITEENQKLIFEGYFTTHDTLQYSSRNPYDFNAGGRGFDLLRMKIFSEQYDFKIDIDSKRCPCIPTQKDRCPGDLEHCRYQSEKDACRHLGGTTIKVKFNAVKSRKETHPQTEENGVKQA